MSKHGSTAFQVTQALNAIFAPGESRHAAKESGDADGHIYSIGTMRTYVEDGARFARWAKATHDIHDIRELTPEHAREYLDILGRKGRAGGYLGRVQSAIEKLSAALHGAHWDLGKGWHSDAHPERAYTPNDANALIADLRAHARDPQTADVVQLQVVAGLRVNEAVRLRGQDFDVEGCQLRLERGTKGGRMRAVTVDPAHRVFLQEMCDLGIRHSDGHVFQGRGSLAGRTERAVNEACKRLGIEDCGTHGFRKTFAQARYVDYLHDNTDDRTARRQLANDLGHGRAAVTVHYVARVCANTDE